jgi:F-type H+-transporting ATPase subunit b
MFLGAAPAWAAAAAPGGGFDAWVHSFNMGSGALVLNPIIILIQWANFLILLIILNKILYKPMRKLMDEREGKIKGDLHSAERDRKEAQGYISQYEDSLAEIQRENTEALVALQREMTEAGRRRVEEIRRETAGQVEEARASIASQAAQARRELEGRARQLAADIANRLAGRKVA